jgi:hypothetical protein
MDAGCYSSTSKANLPMLTGHGSITQQALVVFFQKNFDTSHRDNPAVSLFQLATKYLHAKVSFQAHCFLQAGSPALRMSSLGMR